MISLIPILFYFIILTSISKSRTNPDEMVRKLSANDMSAIPLNQVVRACLDLQIGYYFLEPKVS